MKSLLLTFMLFGWDYEDSDTNDRRGSFGDPNAQTTIEIDRGISDDDVLITERKQMWTKPEDSWGTQRWCTPDPVNKNQMNCTDVSVRR